MPFTCRLEGKGSYRPTARLVGAGPHSRRHNPCHFLTVEWLREDVVAIQIQYSAHKESSATLDVTTRRGEAFALAIRASKSFQLPSGKSASQITTEILESIRCPDACSQSGECKTATGEDPASSIPERAAVWFSEGETTRTVPAAV
jgi:hypothetical protein